MRDRRAPQLKNKARRAACGFAVLFAGLAALAPASAADLIASPPPPPEFTWTGFYAGVNVGGGIDHFAFPYTVSVPVGPIREAVAGTSGITGLGPVGGVQFGFNYQTPFFHIVAGIEVDNDPSGISGQATAGGVLAAIGIPVTATFGSRFIDFGTVRLRLGYAWGRLMPYLTGGFTYGTIETFANVVGPGILASASSTATRTGLPFVRTGAYGVGVEYAIAPNLTMKAEYLYECIIAHPVLFVPAPGVTVSFNTRTMYHIGRIGLNYKFDLFSPPAPVAAKY